MWRVLAVVGLAPAGRAVVGCEVDLDPARVVGGGVESHDVGAKLAAFRRRACWDGLHENTPSARFGCYEYVPNSRGRFKAYVLNDAPARPNLSYWTDGHTRLVELSTRRWGVGE